MVLQREQVRTTGLFSFRSIREGDEAKATRVTSVPILDQLYLDVTKSSECFSYVILTGRWKATWKAAAVLPAVLCGVR